MPEKISIMRDSGETLNSNVVALFTIPDTGKQYIITTENAVDPHGLTVLHVSEIVEDKLKKIATDVIGSCENDGVAEFLKERFKNK